MKFWVASIIIIEIAFTITPLFAQQTAIPDSLMKRLFTQAHLFPQENIYAQTDKSDYVAGDTIWFRAHLVDAISRKPASESRYIYAELINSQVDTLVCRVKARKDSLNMIYGYIALPPFLPKGIYRFRAYTHYARNWGKDSFFNKSLHIYATRKSEAQESMPSLTTDYQVDFFSEGGQAIDRQLCRITFKAQNNRGNGENIHGVIINEKGDTLTTFNCLHNGMGEFSFVPFTGKNYFALCTNDNGMQKRFRLPQAVRHGAALKVTTDRKRCYVSVVHDSLFSTDSLQLLVLQRGLPRFAGHWDKQAGHMIFSKQAFETGTVHFLLLADNGKILSERLAFIQHPDSLSLTLSTSLTKHITRHPIDVAIELKDVNNKFLDGNCSVAVTDASDVPLDETTHILSTLLLTADLKGTIEAPGWYFGSADLDKRAQALDILMRIHGWRRYDLQAAINGQYALPSQLPETSMQLSGEIKSVFGKPIKKSSVQIFAPGTSLITQVETDTKGNFKLNGFEYPDSTRYLITALSHKGKKNVVLQMHPEQYPVVTPQTNATFYHDSGSKKLSTINEDRYVQKVIQNIGYNEGMRHYLLGEVKVSASAKPVYQTEYERDANITIREERIRQSGLPDLGTALRALAGINATSILQNNTAAVVLDGVPIQSEPNSSNPELSDFTLKWLFTAFNINDIEQIDVIKGPLAAGYLQGKQFFLIAITTKKGGEQYNTRYISTNMSVWTPLGYQKPVEMYSPRYEKPSASPNKPDMRTTIYWKPNVIIKDGKAYFSFYTADSPSSYNIIIEGVSTEGNIFRKVETIF